MLLLASAAEAAILSDLQIDMKRMTFLREGLKNFRTIGSVSRSSKYLCKGMLEPVDFAKAKVLVELGAGDGVITHHILKRMAPDAKLLSFEIQKAFCDTLRAIPDDRLIVVEDSAENLPKHLAANGFERADAIVSAIPFVILPKDLAREIVTISRDCLQADGCYTQVHYSTVLKSFYEDIFERVNINFVPINIPPAFVFHCGK